MAALTSPNYPWRKKKSKVKKLLALKIAGILIPAIGMLFLYFIIIIIIAAAAYNANKWAIHTYQVVNQAYTNTVEFFYGKEPGPDVPTAVMQVILPLEQKYKIPWVFLFAISKDRSINDYDGIARELTADDFAIDFRKAIDKYGVDNQLGDGYSSKVLNSMDKYLKVPPLIYPLPLGKGIVTEEEGTDRVREDGSHYIHQGIDVADVKDTPILAAVSGTVIVNVAGSASAGNFVEILSHDKTIRTRYLHMSSQSQLKVGQEISAGDYIGPMGATGDVTGVHLHFEVWMNGKLQNPRDFVFFPRTKDGASDGLDRRIHPTTNSR